MESGTESTYVKCSYIWLHLNSGDLKCVIFSACLNSSLKTKQWNLGRMAPHTCEIFLDLMMPKRWSYIEHYCFYLIEIVYSKPSSEILDWWRTYLKYSYIWWGIHDKGLQWVIVLHLSEIIHSKEYNWILMGGDSHFWIILTFDDTQT